MFLSVSQIPNNYIYIYIFFFFFFLHEVSVLQHCAFSPYLLQLPLKSLCWYGVLIKYVHNFQYYILIYLQARAVTFLQCTYEKIMLKLYCNMADGWLINAYQSHGQAKAQIHQTNSYLLAEDDAQALLLTQGNQC